MLLPLPPEYWVNIVRSHTQPRLLLLHVSVHACLPVQARVITGSDSGVFSIVPPYFLRQGLSLDLEGAALARLADPARPWICLSLFPSTVVLDTCCPVWL